MPPSLSAADGEVPGKVGSVLWLWESDSENGRLVAGRARYTPLGLTVLRKLGGGGPQLCAKVYEGGTTYCPISRLKAKPYVPLKTIILPDGSELESLNSGCPQVDEVLAAVQIGKRTTTILRRSTYRWKCRCPILTSC